MFSAIDLVGNLTAEIAAVTECARRGPKMVALLERTLRTRDLRQRAGALWALVRIVGGEPDPADGTVADSAARRAVRLALDDRGELDPFVAVGVVLSLGG